MDSNAEVTRFLNVVFINKIPTLEIVLEKLGPLYGLRSGILNRCLDVTEEGHMIFDIGVCWDYVDDQGQAIDLFGQNERTREYVAKGILNEMHKKDVEDSI